MRGPIINDVLLRCQPGWFECATHGKELHSCMLDMDHIDGDHYHNVEENIQTLCKNCHSYKTKMNGDNRTGW